MDAASVFVMGHGRDENHLRSDAAGDDPRTDQESPRLLLSTLRYHVSLVAEEDAPTVEEKIDGTYEDNIDTAPAATVSSSLLLTTTDSEPVQLAIVSDHSFFPSCTRQVCNARPRLPRPFSAGLTPMPSLVNGHSPRRRTHTTRCRLLPASGRMVLAGRVPLVSFRTAGKSIRTCSLSRHTTVSLHQRPRSSAVPAVPRPIPPQSCESTAPHDTALSQQQQQQRQQSASPQRLSRQAILGGPPPETPRRGPLGTHRVWTTTWTLPPSILHFMTSFPHPHTTLLRYTVTHPRHGPRSRSHTHPPFRSHVRIPIGTDRRHGPPPLRQWPLACLGPESRISLPAADPCLGLSQPLDELHPIPAGRTDFRMDPDHLFSSGRPHGVARLGPAAPDFLPEWPWPDSQISKNINKNERCPTLGSNA